MAPRIKSGLAATTRVNSVWSLSPSGLETLALTGDGMTNPWHEPGCLVVVCLDVKRHRFRYVRSGCSQCSPAPVDCGVHDLHVISWIATDEASDQWLGRMGFRLPRLRDPSVDWDW